MCLVNVGNIMIIVGRSRSWHAIIPKGLLRLKCRKPDAMTQNIPTQTVARAVVYIVNVYIDYSVEEICFHNCYLHFEVDSARCVA